MRMVKGGHCMQNVKWLHIVILLFFILSAGYIIVVSIHQPFLGIELEKEGGDWKITEVQRGSWADEQSVPQEAKVVSVEGQMPEEHFTVSMFKELEMAREFAIQYANHTVYYKNIEQLSPMHWGLYIIVPFLFFIAVMGISYLLHKKAPKRYFVDLLILYFLVVALGYLSNSGAIRNDLYSIFLNTSLFLFSPVILIHFLYNYFQTLNVKWFSKKIYYSLYVGVLLASLIESYCLLSHSCLSWFAPIPGWLLFSLYILLFIIIYRGLYLNRAAEYGSIFKYISVGMTVAFWPYIVLYLIPSLTFGKQIISLEFAAMFLVALPITFVYLVTRERLIDIGFVISRVRYYSIISVIPSVLIVCFFAWIAEFSWSMVEYVQIFLIIHLLLIFFLSGKEILDFRLQRYLFAAKYSYQESMHRISQEMKEQSNVVDLMKVMRDELKSVLDVQDIYIYSKHNDRNVYCVYDPLPNDLIDYFNHQLTDQTLDIGAIIETEKGFGVIVGISLEKLTMVWCRGKKDYTTLNRDEKTYLQTVSHNANIAIENMNLIEDLVKELRTLKSDQTHKYPTWLSRLLFSIAENQRKQLSIDLHDTLLQEQLYLYRKMDDLITKRDDLPSTLQAELSVYKESLLDSIHLIRETCNELRPAFIEELGLVQSLKNLIQQYQLRSNFTVYFIDEYFDADLDQERVLAIFRIVQELLTNAMKHSGAKIVKLSLSNDHRQVVLVYTDNGKGMGCSHRRDLFSHIGLSGIEQRVNGLNGYLEIDTAPNKGFKAMVMFPFTVNKGGDL